MEIVETKVEDIGDEKKPTIKADVVVSLSLEEAEWLRKHFELSALKESEDYELQGTFRTWRQFFGRGTWDIQKKIGELMKKRKVQRKPLREPDPQNEQEAENG